MRRLGLLVATCLLSLLPACGGANVAQSPRPEARAARADDFAAWRVAFAARARAAGIGAATLARVRPHLRYLPGTIALDRRQREFGTRVWDYMDRVVTPRRIADGRAALAAHRGLLDRIAERHGVPPAILVAIWGVESAYGANRGATPILATLATLAKDGRRGAFFEAELLAALHMVQDGAVAPARLVGSWAGAFGHTQFMPTSYRAHAVDFDGDGRTALWADAPADALASTANYLSAKGWQRGQPWAVEVVMPDGVDLALTGARRGVRFWAAAGLAAAHGGALPAGRARLLLPAGAQGPAWLAYGNYAALKAYNISDAYVLAVGHLADRLRGRPPLHGDWPRDDRALTLAERKALQRALVAAGFDTAGIDGRIGPATRAAVRGWQRANGLPPDGYVNAALLARLRAAR